MGKVKKRKNKILPHTFYYCHTCDTKDPIVCNNEKMCLLSKTTVMGGYNHTMYNVKSPHIKHKHIEVDKPMFTGSSYPNLSPEITNISPKDVAETKISPLVEYVCQKVSKEQEDYLKKVFGESMEPENLTEHLKLRG